MKEKVYILTSGEFDCKIESVFSSKEEAKKAGYKKDDCVKWLFCFFYKVFNLFIGSFNLNRTIYF